MNPYYSLTLHSDKSNDPYSNRTNLPLSQPVLSPPPNQLKGSDLWDQD